jgi:hypothetical protein
MKLSWVDWYDWIFAWEFTGIDGVKWVKTWVKQYGYFFVGLIGMIKKKVGKFRSLSQLYFQKHCISWNDGSF